jgi:outer membrane protein assembly factor BamD
MVLMPIKPRKSNWMAAASVAVALIAFNGCGHKQYENPIDKDTLQPDKILFDRAIKDMEHGRYDIARLTLHTLVSTYDTSEYLAKAKLAIADSWYREGGSHGLAQAEAEYKDFELFYPMMEEAAEAQMKVCMIHYKQMEKPDRDMTHALRAEDECRQVLVQFPNSRFAPEAQQQLRDVQEVIAESEYRVGTFYHRRGSYAAAANRLEAMTEHYPLYSKADDALWQLGDSYSKMGGPFRDKAADAFARIVREYPLSPLVDEAKKRLLAMEKPVPEADPVALARMQYELENYNKPGLMSHFWGIFRTSPDMSAAAKSGEPAMTAFRPTVPVTVPGAAPAGVQAGMSAEVTVSTVPESGSSALDTKPDARQNPPDGQKKQEEQKK